MYKMCRFVFECLIQSICYYLSCVSSHVTVPMPSSVKKCQINFIRSLHVFFYRSTMKILQGIFIADNSDLYPNYRYNRL